MNKNKNQTTAKMAHQRKSNQTKNKHKFLAI